MKHRCIFHKRP